MHKLNKCLFKLHIFKVVNIPLYFNKYNTEIRFYDCLY